MSKTHPKNEVFLVIKTNNTGGIYKIIILHVYNIYNKRIKGIHLLFWP